MVVQLTHAWPEVPHVVSERDMHVPVEPPAQQPLGHDVESQRQVPLTQRWPLAHIAPPPHVQLPLALQPSARLPHDMHEAPAGAQAAAVRGD